MTLQKYPRTPHLQGSRSQPGDEDLEDVPLSVLEGLPVVVEEKIDGANAGLSFDEDGELWLQSRGHYLTGGEREKHFQLFKTWAQCHRPWLWEVLGSRYLVYGEWCYAKHTCFYDALPHYFLEFDVFDRASGLFLSTSRRRALWEGRPVVSVPVLYEGPFQGLPSLGPALYRTGDWLLRLDEQARKLGLSVERVRAETDLDPRAEGWYVKTEEDGRVTGRYKFVRASFLTAVLDSGTHWLQRPLVPNLLADGTDIFSG